MADPVSALMVISATTAVAKGVSEIGAAGSRSRSLDLQKDQGILAHQQKTLANFENMQKVLDRQVAEATTRGIGLGSPSLEAIQRNTVNVGAKNAKNLDTENDIFQSNIAAEKSNVKSTLFAQLFGDVAGTASDFAAVRAKMPAKA